MVEIRKGITSKPASSQKLIDFFKSHNELDGHLYIGYPILFAAGESTTIDALWLSKKYGVIVFDIVEGTSLDDRSEIQNELYAKTNSLFLQHPKLVDKRTLAVLMEVITFAPACKSHKAQGLYAFDDKSLIEIIKKMPSWSRKDLYEYLTAVIQSVIKLKIADKRSNVKQADSKGAKLIKLGATIDNLDSQQEKAIIDFNEGIHRIRGLAGSGKTIVLALKVAYLHAQNPDWKIAVTFNTRSLKNQFKELIERFCIEKKGEMPNWDNVRILQAWGSPKNNGIYYDLCKEHGIEYLDYKAASQAWAQAKQTDRSVFDFICAKALTEIKDYKEQYDAILVDEAQDLSNSFLKLCFNMLKPPKNLIYAYDELQKLNVGSSLGNPQTIFRVKDFTDTILSKCYRNSRPVLVTAHALGFGVYRNVEEKEKIVQFFDQPQLWQDVGYEVKEGKLEAGSKVVLHRTEESSPKYLESHSDIEDILTFRSFKNSQEQAKWVADEIEKNLKTDELLFKDIIVINPDALTTKREIALIRSLLLNKSINNHIAGDFNADVFFEEGSITFTGINRAKGNEVPMVYIINADDCFEGQELIKKRNTLFTAITRSKAWVRLCGVGDRMDRLIKEYEEVKKRDFELHFTYPTAEEIQRLNLIHRDMSLSEKQIINKDVNALRDISDAVERIRDGKSYIEDYPKEYHDIIGKLLK